jgi:hypothetical protein
VVAKVQRFHNTGKILWALSPGITRGGGTHITEITSPLDAINPNTEWKFAGKYAPTRWRK